MMITVRDMQGVCVMTISGRIDLNSSGDLERSLHDAINDNSRILMDLADTEYISSSGLRTLLAGKKMVKERNGEIVLASLQPVVRDVFEITGLVRLFFIKKSLEDALTYMNRRQ